MLALLAAPLAAAPLGWAPNITTTATWNSNATNANRSPDVVGALQLHGNAAVSRRFALGPDDALLAGAQLSAEAWPRFDGLDRAAIGPRVTWQHKFGLGPLAPVFSLALTGEAVAARESDRAGLTGSATLALRKRIDDATRIVLSHEFARHDARAFVFDRTGAETALEFTRDLAEPWSLTTTARWREGDVLSYATPPRPDLVALAHTRVANSTFNRTFVAYSLEARTLTGALALARALDQSTALSFTYEWRETTRGPLRYTNHLVSATLVHQF